MVTKDPLTEPVYGLSCGFTFRIVISSGIAQGFKTIIGRRDQKNFALWVMAFKSENTEIDKDALALQYFN